MLVYEKEDNVAAETANLDILHAVFVDASRTADYQTTTGIKQILERDGNVDDLMSLLVERNLPLDEIGCRNLAERILVESPRQGFLTVSNALQWRLQYGRAISAPGRDDSEGLMELLL